jgi:hypothetical protein
VSSEQSRRRRRLIVLVVGCLIAATFFAWMSEERAPQEVSTVRFPRGMTDDDWRRARARGQTPPVFSHAPAASPALAPRDALLDALPATMTSSAVVLEANAIVSSPIGAALMGCLAAQAPEMFEAFKRANLDPRQAIDRVAMVDDVMVASGTFAEAHLDRIIPGSSMTPHGARGRIYRPQQDGGEIVGVWKDQVAVFARSPEEITRALDRLENPTGQTPVIDPSQAYGDIYGSIAPAALTSLLDDGQAGLTSRLKGLTSPVVLHVNTGDDVAMVMDVTSTNQADVDDLGKAFGAAVALLRVKAQAGGDSALAGLLGAGRAALDMPGRARLELALPARVLNAHLEKCAADKRPTPPAVVHNGVR